MSELSTHLAETLPLDSEAGPGWLKALRATGAEQFRSHGLPTRKDEHWKYTGLGVLEQYRMQSPTETEAVLGASSHAPALVAAETQVSMLDGRMLSQEGLLPKGLTVLSLADALDKGMGGLRVLLESLSVEGSSDGFTALNTATLDSGVVIHVAAGANGGRLLMNWATLKGAGSRWFNTRLCVIVEQDARLELLEQFEGPADNANTSNIVLQVELGSNASLQHIRFQQESADAVLVTRTEILQQKDSNYAYYGFDLGGGLVRHDLHASLQGGGAKSSLNGAYLLDGNRHVDNHARVDHMAPGGYSEQYFRGVASGSGRAVFNTAVCVHPGADETEARQSNANLLLSSRAEVDTKPELEIYADEVIASHGATVGQLDEQAVFYMRSRGLSEQDARQVLTTAFCRSVSDKLDDPVLGELISQRMMAVMPQGE
jgi:Fe-S cluster assembly protein SufD